jgi:hypothetical protein
MDMPAGFTSEASPQTAERRGWPGCHGAVHAGLMAATVTVNDVLDGHVGLDLECMDRIYLNGYVPNRSGCGTRQTDR